MTIDRLTREDFTDLPPASLAIRLKDGDLPLAVTGLRDLPGHSPRSAPFAVTLEGPRDPMLPQGIYPLMHPKHGQLDVFIVPVARDQAHTQYELIFN
ncbi:MAG: hypothetical protein H7255_19845 [Ramlibacter sp.]|nr:hypothetical protein [Ramlibacter sp.]